MTCNKGSINVNYYSYCYYLQIDCQWLFTILDTGSLLFPDHILDQASAPMVFTCYSSAGVWILLVLCCCCCCLSFKQQKFSLSQFGRPEVQGVSRATPSGRSSKESVQCLFQLLVGVSIAWLVAISLQSLPSSSCHLLLCASVSDLPLPLSYKDTYDCI